MIKEYPMNHAKAGKFPKSHGVHKRRSENCHFCFIPIMLLIHALAGAYHNCIVGADILGLSLAVAVSEGLQG